jgi:hypothetical protein
VDCSDARCCLPGECADNPDGGTPSSDACESNDDCGEGKYCLIHSCGGTGQCLQGTTCGDNLRLVCGCDGQTYDNECTAQHYGVAVAYEGECDDIDAGIPSTTGCSSNADCDDAEYCHIEGCAETGECSGTMPCDAILAPVCGCDGQTYGNECEAHSNGVGISAQGECSSENPECPGAAGCGCDSNDDCDTDLACLKSDCSGGVCGSELLLDCEPGRGPVCGCDGVTYDDACETLFVGVEYDGQCTADACLSPDDCGDGRFCYREDCDAPGQCMDGEEPICPPEFDPTCSCDGATMDSCTARNSGAGVDYVGECVDDLSYGANWRSTRISFGECLGDCAFRLTRDLNDPDRINYAACDYAEMDCSRNIVLELNADGMALLQQAHREFRGAALEEQYGCPDCADGGATLVVLESNDGITQHEYEYSNPPAEFESLDSLMLDLHVSMYDCSEGMYFSIVGECTPAQ